MALVTLADLLAFTGITTTAAQDISLTAIIADVSDAINQACRPWLFEPQEVTAILDAPLDEKLTLPAIPVRSVTAIYLNWQASGESADFGAENLLAQYTDYYLELDDPVNGYSESGIVYKRSGRLNGMYWGGERRWPVNALGSTLTVGRGAIKAIFQAGTLTVPSNVKMATILASMLIYNRRQTGFPVTSESWNGYSYGASGPFTAEAAIYSPDVYGLLKRYMSAQVARP